MEKTLTADAHLAAPPAPDVLNATTYQVIAAISVVGPESRFDAQTSIGVESAVIGAARALSQMFGHRPES